MLYECNKPRYLFLKYGPLFFSVLVFSNIYSIIASKDSNYLVGLSFVGIVSGLLLLLFIFTKNRIKFVSIGKTKLVVKQNNEQREYSWLDVESIVLDRVFGVYTLHLKNEKPIYFPTYEGTTWFFGDQSEMGAIIAKMKKELDI